MTRRIDPALWTNALRSACDFVGGYQALMFWQDAASDAAAALYSYNDDPHYTQLYYKIYAPLNPVFPAAIFQEVGAVHTAIDLVPEAELRETRFYKEWIAPQGMHDFISVVLEKDAIRAAFLSVQWRGDPIGDQPRRRMALLVPHFQRAVAIGRLFVKQKADDASLTATLDRAESGVFLVGEGGRIVFANASGRQMIGDGSLLHASNNILHAVAADSDRSLDAGFRAMAQEGATINARGVTVVLSDAPGGRWVANILPLVDGARRRTGQAHHAIAAVFVRSSVAADPSPLEALARLHGLTASEIRVAEAVLRVSGNEAIADALGISRVTVRTHLNHIYRKSVAKNQG